MPDQDQGFDSSKLLDVLGLLGGGAVAKAAATKPILGAIIGSRARNWNKENEALAKGMMGSNTAENIYDKTKLYPGHTGGLRQYIPDEGLVPKKLPDNVPNEGIPFQDVVEWPEMFNNYPHIADIPIKFNQPETSYGWAEHINLQGGADPKGVTTGQLYGLAHEGQHGVAHYQGWPVGGRPDTFTKWMKDKLPYRESVLRTPDRDLFWDYQNPNTERLIKEVGKDPNVLGREMYMRHPGETESRLEETLLRYLKFNDMTPRYKTRLYPQDEAMTRFRDMGLSLDTKWAGGSTEHGLRNWLTPNKVNPETLPFNERNVWDYLSSSNNTNAMSKGQFDWLRTGKLYPWKFEDYPRGLQNDYSEFR